jgi:hypothetical protein
MAYAVTTHCTEVDEAWSWLLISGKATLTMLKSSVTTSCALRTTARARRPSASPRTFGDDDSEAPSGPRAVRSGAVAAFTHRPYKWPLRPTALHSRSCESELILDGADEPGAVSNAMVKIGSDEARYRSNLRGEIDSAVVYRAMADAEPNPQLASVYVRLAQVEERHLGFWEDQLRGIGREPGPRRASWRGRMLAMLARRFGPHVVLPTVATLEQVDQAGYDDQPETDGTPMRAQERSHARVLRYVAGGSPRGLSGETVAKLEGRHRAPGGNALRAAVLGANDGLTSNLALVMGVSGAHLASPAVLVTGLTGLLAGACSMAIGEWISVESARELYQRQVGIEAAELRDVPDEEQ